MENPPDWGVIAVILTALVTFIGGVAKIVQELRKQKHEQSREDKKDTVEQENRTIQEQQKFIERQTQIIEQQRQETHAVRNQLNVLTLQMMDLRTDLARAETWIIALEGMLQNSKLPFRPYVPSNTRDSAGSFDIPKET